MSFTTRTATVEDSAQIADIHVSSWLAAYAGLVPAHVLAVQSVDRQETSWREILSQRADGTVVASTPADELVGFVSFGPCRTDKMTGEIYALYVRPDYFRTGTGRMLWEAATSIMGGLPQHDELPDRRRRDTREANRQGRSRAFRERVLGRQLFGVEQAAE